MAPTPAQSFGAIKKKASKIYLMVPVWYLAYVGIGRVSIKNSFGILSFAEKKKKSRVEK
jgi:hypothetical protein